jgi:hypothetical protein
VTTIGGCGVPLSVVERAVQEYDCRIKKKNKSTDSFEIFEVWAVFDRDAHPEKQVPNAFKLAATNNIFVAFSNPCFEVWGLMHFSCFGKPGHHHEAQAVLKSKLPSYCHTKNPYIDALALHNRYSEAVRNSIQALDARKNEQNMNGDPSTVDADPKLIRWSIFNRRQHQAQPYINLPNELLALERNNMLGIKRSSVNERFKALVRPSHLKRVFHAARRAN